MCKRCSRGSGRQPSPDRLLHMDPCMVYTAHRLDYIRRGYMKRRKGGGGGERWSHTKCDLFYAPVNRDSLLLCNSYFKPFPRCFLYLIQALLNFVSSFSVTMFARRVESCFFTLILSQLVRSQLQISLSLFTDLSCAVPSTSHATVSTSTENCLVTTGLGSISNSNTPCSNGDVQLLLFSDTSCTQQLSSLDYYRVTKDCLARFSGDIAAVMLTCNQNDGAGNIDAGSAVATSTIPVGMVAGSASASPTSSGTASSPSSGTTTGGSSDPSATTSDINNTNNDANPSSSSPKLSTSDIITIAVGLGVGIPTVAIAYQAYKYPNYSPLIFLLRRSGFITNAPHGHSQPHHHPESYPNNPIRHEMGGSPSFPRYY